MSIGGRDAGLERVEGRRGGGEPQVKQREGSEFTVAKDTKRSWSNAVTCPFRMLMRVAIENLPASIKMLRRDRPLFRP